MIDSKSFFNAESKSAVKMPLRECVRALFAIRGFFRGNPRNRGLWRNQSTFLRIFFSNRKIIILWWHCKRKNEKKLKTLCLAYLQTLKFQFFSNFLTFFLDIFKFLRMKYRWYTIHVIMLFVEHFVASNSAKKSCKKVGKWPSYDKYLKILHICHFYSVITQISRIFAKISRIDRERIRGSKFGPRIWIRRWKIL